MDDKTAANAGLPRVDASKLTHPDADRFKDQIHGAFLRHAHDVGSHTTMKSVELRDDPDEPGHIQATLHSQLGPIEVPFSESTPVALADLVYQWLSRK